MHRLIRHTIVTLALMGFATAGAAAAPESAGARPAPGEGSPLPYSAAAILGLVEGVTEFLPISSTGHLILTINLLTLDHENPARDLNGRLLPIKKSSNPDATPTTVKDAADTYSVVIQAGAILAVVILYWQRLIGILMGIFGKNPGGLRLLRNIVIGVFPAGVFGLTFGHFIETHLFSIHTVAAALIVGAIGMILTERWRRASALRSGGSMPDIDPADLTPQQALFIGLLQCLALWPGMSRSMVTIVGGNLAGLRPARAAEFSFLLGIPTLTGAALLKAHSSGSSMVACFGAAPLAFGCLVATVAAALSVRWLINYLNNHGFGVFAVYRLILAVVVLAVL